MGGEGLGAVDFYSRRRIESDSPGDVDVGTGHGDPDPVSSVEDVRGRQQVEDHFDGFSGNELADIILRNRMKGQVQVVVWWIPKAAA